MKEIISESLRGEAFPQVKELESLKLNHYIALLLGVENEGL